MQTPIADQIAPRLGLPVAQVAATVALFDAGNTLPFVARYRKEQTGGLDEEQLRQLQTLLVSQRALNDRRDAILAALTTQGQLTPALEQALTAADTLTALEDLYQPFRPKRRTRAGTARENGLQPLADLILAQAPARETAEQMAARFVTEAVPTVEAALAGARDIVAEAISDHAGVRRTTRERALQWATVRAERRDGSEDPRGVFQTYYDFEGRVARLRPYQVLALNRGETTEVLKVQVAIPERDWRDSIALHFRVNSRSPWAVHLNEAIPDAAQRLLLPAIERDVRRTLTEQAEAHAIRVFAANLRALLLQPPITNTTVLGIDPGLRTGCKLAVVDPTGKVVATTTIMPHAPQRRWADSLATLADLIRRHTVTLIAIGNGTASRESEQLVAEVIRNQPNVHYLMVNEAGASVYSASTLARAELPELDVSLRGAVSIARRVQDPLAELVKIDPQAIGVGLYQHDVDQNQLAAALADVVESVVNRVGVDLNTASPALLTHISGIGPKLADRIVAYRAANGPFPNRRALRQVTGLGPKAFEQAAGFLRIRDGSEPLDATAIHPESYAVAAALLKRASVSLAAPFAERQTALAALQPTDTLAAELGTGPLTLADIIEQLLRPGRDPRADLPAPLLRSDVLSMDDLAPGVALQGTVRNVVDFGVFVDIGVKQDGLLHRTQVPPGVVLNVGDIIPVTVATVDAQRGRIGLAWDVERAAT